LSRPDPVPMVPRNGDGGGSTTLPVQLPSETKCPDPPANLFPLPIFFELLSMKQRVPSRSSPAPTGRDGSSLGRSAAQAQDPETLIHIQSSPLSPYQSAPALTAGAADAGKAGEGLGVRGARSIVFRPDLRSRVGSRISWVIFLSRIRDPTRPLVFSPSRDCRGSFLPLVKKDPHHRRGSFFRSRRGSFPGALQTSPVADWVTNSVGHRPIKNS
jgi:hypothetical protein